MNKRIVALLLALCLLMAGMGSAGAQSLLDHLGQIIGQNALEGMAADEVLKLVGQEGAESRILLRDSFTRLDYVNSDYLESCSDDQILILWRESPLKEYSRSDTPFGDDYEGVNLGRPKVYLCADMMARLPEERRPATLDEVDLVIMLETLYMHTATISTYTDDNDKDEQLPSMAAMELWLSDGENAPGQQEQSLGGDVVEEEHQNLTYAPCFTAYAMVTLYDWATGDSIDVLMESYDFDELRANPAADDCWEAMVELLQIHDAALEATDTDTLAALIEDQVANLTDEEIAALLELPTEQLPAYCTEQFWRKAEELKTLDPEAAEHIQVCIDQQSIQVLSQLVNMRGYSAVGMEDDQLVEQLAYIGQPQQKDLEKLLDQVIRLCELLDWNLQALVGE